jgi:adenosylhomocysteine nucleosidase
MDEPHPPPDFTHAHVGIVHATAMEISPFLARCERVRKYTGGDLTFRGGLLGTARVAFAESGVGAAQARRATQALLDGHSPDWVISAGYSGALRPEMKVGDIVVASAIIDTAGAKLSIDIQMPANPAGGLYVGPLLMVDRMIAKAEEKRSLGEQTGALAVDMESLEVARLCQAAKKRFLAVRVISDDLSSDMPLDVLSIVNSSGVTRWGAVAGALFRRLGSAQDMWRLREQAQRASERLATFLDGVVHQLHGATQPSR